jgi:uncharacterized membrane protein YagU involved in acid resistance
MVATAELGLGQRVAAGAGAGLAGTMVILGLHAATEKLAPGAVEPMRDDPGNFMTWQGERLLPRRARHRVPESLESLAAMGLHFDYGVAFGVLYGLLRPRAESGAKQIVLEGSLLGLACWAVGYLGWLPATGLMPPVTRQKPAQVAGPIVQHIAYGIAAVAVFDWLRGKMAQRRD